MFRPLILLSLASLTYCGWACALLAKGTNETMFPSDVGWNDDFLIRHNEPALWVPAALSKHPSRLRMVMDGINCTRAIVRIDETKAHRFTGSYILEYRCGRGRPEVKTWQFTVSRRAMSEFHELARSEGILQQPRLGWDLSDDGFCLDGEEVLIEFVNAAGYRATGANMSCTAPPNFRKVAEAILTLADADEAKALLRP